MKLSLRKIQPQKTIAFVSELTLDNLKKIYPVVWERNKKEKFTCFYSGVKVTIYQFESGLNKNSYIVLETETDNFTTYQCISSNSGKLPDLETTVQFIKQYQNLVDSFPSADNVLTNLTTDDRFLADVRFSLHSRDVKAEYTIGLPEYTQTIETVSTSITRICKRFNLSQIISEAEKIAEKKKLDSEYYQAVENAKEKGSQIMGARLDHCSDTYCFFKVSIPVDRLNDFQVFLDTL